MVVLGALNISNLEDVEDGSAALYCFLVNNTEEDAWELCAQS